MTQEELIILLDKYAQGNCTEEEIRRIDEWFEALDEEGKSALPEAIQNNWLQYKEDLYRKVHDRIQTQNGKQKRMPVYRWMKVAAILLAIITVTGILYYAVQKKEHVPLNASIAATKEDAQPGGNHAVLTLSSGAQILLDSMANGQITAQPNAHITKPDSGLLVYKSGNPSGQDIYNTVRTPKGGQFSIRLSDGTSVWLNADSYIKFPVAFSGTERKVEVSGEVYFEVAHNAAKPFIVQTGQTIIKDIGTHFNIQNYPDEQGIKTTLLEGAVSVNNRLLKPGQQVVVTDNGTLNVHSLSDPDEVIAWKEGLINFHAENIPELLRQLARWYNIEAATEGTIPDIHLTGTIPRNMKLSSVMQVLEINGFNCAFKNNKLIVTKK